MNPSSAHFARAEVALWVGARLIAMAHRLGLEVVAEGVETAAQLAFLRREGCDTAWGYLLGRPMLAAEAESLLRRPLGPRGARPAAEALQARINAGA